MVELSIKAVWDEDARVWFAESEDVPGLATEAGTLDALTAKLRTLVPELLELNGIQLPVEDHDLPFRVIAERTEHVRIGV